LNGSIFYPGSDHAVLMLHGLSSSPLEMRHLARYLNSEGLTACAPNLHGYSAGTSELRMEAWLEAAVREFDALSARYPRVSVCGLSMGATLALALVRERPSVQAIVLLSVTLKYDGWAMPWYRFLLGWAYYTPLRQRWRYKEASPFGLRNEALRAKIGRQALFGTEVAVARATFVLGLESRCSGEEGPGYAEQSLKIVELATRQNRQLDVAPAGEHAHGAVVASAPRTVARYRPLPTTPACTRVFPVTSRTSSKAGRWRTRSRGR